ncbi:MAG: PRC-barrel domain-containing protein [Patescibacteria group bacterium]
MEKFYSKILGMPVIEEDAMRPFTSITDVVMDPANGKLLAFVVNANRNQIILPMDIIGWNDAVHINSRDSIIDGNESLRVQKVQEGGVRIIHNKVETQGGTELGKVYDFVIDPHTFELRKLFVAKGFLNLFRFDSRIISAKNIIEILKDKIVVKEDLVGLKARKNEVILEDMAVS